MKKLTENHLRKIAVLFLVDRDWYALAVVPHRNLVLSRINRHLNQVHSLVSLEIICGIHQDFIYKYT